MNKKTLPAALALLAAIGGAGTLWRLTQGHQPGHPELRASLADGALADADLDDGTEPAPAVGRDYDLSAHQTLSRVVLLIRENYVEPDRIKPYEMFLVALDYIEKTIPEVMVDETDAPARVVVSVGSASQPFELGGLDQLWEVTMALRDIFRFLQGHIEDPTQRRDVEYAAINGMLSTLDPHSILLKPENFDEVRLATKGEFGGLGIVIAIRDAALTIMSPIDGTPASRAGLKAKDKIVKIGEESTINMGLDEAVQRLRGKPGSSVLITVARKTWSEPHKVSLERAIIKIESVTSELLADGIGYVKLKSFQGNTYDDLQDHLTRLEAKNKRPLAGLVLDLRNNPGGLLDAAIMVSDRFIERGPLVITVSEGSRKREVKNARLGGNESAYPMAVLLNGGSASASEIVSGALKNHNRALVIGQQSFGKGSVQVLYDFKDRSALKLTIAQYLTPGDLSIQSTGITPDVQIVPAMIDRDSVHLFVDDDAPREKDLEKHLDQHGSVQVVEASQVKITHLMPHDEAHTPPEDEVLPGTAFEYDFETELAHDVLLRAHSIDRRAALKEALPLFRARADAQDEQIARRLGELGVDWARGPAAAGATPAPTPGEGAATVALETAASAHPAVAGSTVVLAGTVTNRGSVPLYRVYGVTTSDNPLLKSLEFIFGRVDPGQSRRWEVKIKLPPDMSARADRVKLALADASGSLRGTEAGCFVHVAERQRPRFAYAFRIDDAEHGNGDGVLAVGEQVNLRVRVENRGPGAAEDATVSLKNLSLREVFLDQGRAKLGAMAVGAHREAVLRFTVQKPLERVKMRLAVWDGTLGAPISESLVLPVVGPRRAQPEAHAVAAKAKGGAPVYAGADAAMPLAGCLRPGAPLKSDAAFADGWYRVALAPGEVGFVARADVTVAADRPASKAGASFVPAGATAAPEIVLALPSLVVDGDTLHLTGKVLDDRRLKDVFVFVNDKKVYFRALGEVKRTAAGVQAGIDIPVRLKPGSNGVAVIVREDDDMVARQMFGVYRNEAASRPLPPPPPAPDRGVTAGPPTQSPPAPNAPASPRRPSPPPAGAPQPTP